MVKLQTMMSVKKLMLTILLCTVRHAHTSHVESILASVAKSDFKQLQSQLTNHTLSAQEKIQILEHAHSIANPHREKEETRKSVFATLCVIFWVSGGCLLEDACRTYGYFGSMNTRTLLATLGCIGAAIGCGYECEKGYYTARALYIEKYLNKLFNVQYQTVVTISDSLGTREYLIS